MTFTLTLVAADILSDEEINTLYNFLDEDNITHQKEIKWLIPNKSAAIKIQHILTLPQIKKLRHVFNIDKIDIFCTEIKPYKLFLADMDSTIVTSETLDELADEANIKSKIADITARAMRGELDFHDAIRERVGLLKNLPVSALQKTLDNTKTSTGAEVLLKTLKQNALFCVLVSGGFTHFTQPIANQLGFDKNHGNTLNIENNVLTGDVIDPILDKESKLALLQHYVSVQKCDLSESITIGDGANDLPMLEAAQNAGGLGIGYQPKPLVADTILNCIIHTDLKSVLYMQGLTPE